MLKTLSQEKQPKKPTLWHESLGPGCLFFEICHWSSRTDVTLVWGKFKLALPWPSELKLCNYLMLKDSIGAIQICHSFADFRTLQITATSFPHPCMHAFAHCDIALLPSTGGTNFTILPHLGWLWAFLWPVVCSLIYVVEVLSFGFKSPCNFCSCLSGMLPPPEAQTSFPEDKSHGR